MEVREAIDRINEDIVEIIGNYVDIKTIGNKYRGCCPFHNEKTPSFTITPARGIFKCFGCGKGGDAITFIQEHENVEFLEAVEIGAKKLNLDFERSATKVHFNDEEYKHKEALRIVVQRAAEFFADQLKNTPEALKYLEDRNFSTTETDEKENNVVPFLLGYAPDGNVLLKWAKKEAINLNLLLEADLIKSKEGREYDTFRNRIIFPISTKAGKIIGFTGRTLEMDKEVLKAKGIAKYSNTSETPIYTKGHELFALNLARNDIKKEDKAYLVEGNFDVTRMHQIGIQNTIAPCGTALTIEQAKLLKLYTNKVTLIYDGDEPGQKAMVKNAEILIKEQFHVSVIILDKEQDPDSVFTSPEAFETINSAQKDYIIFKTEAAVEKAKSPAHKSDLIKEIAYLITRYDEPSKQDIYLEAVSNIIKPKKLWVDFIKTWLDDKAPIEAKKSNSIIPNDVSLADYDERGFYVSKNCMYFKDAKGHPKMQSNFTMTPLFHIESTVNAKRLYEVKNSHNTVRVIEIPQRDLVSISAFKVRIESLGNFLWTGSETDLNRLKAWLYEKTNSAKEVTQMGWNKDGIYVWGNGIFNGKFTETDQYGIATNNGENYYIPSASKIYSKEENLFEFERKFIHVEGNITLREYVKKFTKVFGENGKIALSFYFASLFRDIVIRKFSKYPILNLFGPKGAGKNACAESLLFFFGRLPKIPNLHNTSKPALADHVATSSNALCVLDEYRNDLEMEKREFLKGLWDGTGRTRMNMDKDKKKETTSVDQGVIVCGQQMATADIALFSRFIVLSFTQTEFSKEEIKLYEELEEINKRGLTHITHQILKHRAYFKENYSKKVDQVSLDLEKLLKGQAVETRVFNNWLMIMSAYATLNDELELPWDYTETLQLSVKLMLMQNGEMKKNDDLGHFWKVVGYLASSNLIFEGGDYKLREDDKVKRIWMEGAEWKKDTIQYLKPKKLFYLTTARVFSLYKSQCLREGDKPLPESTIEYYLKNSKAFLFETKKESFNKIDPRTGTQEKTEEGKKKRTSTTAFVFDYDLLNISVETGGEEEDLTPDSPPAEPVASIATQIGLEFGKKEEEKDPLPF